jgi:hypothetical protein
MKSTFPIIFQDANVLSSNFADEDSSDEWNIATAYSVGDYVHLVSTHTVYRCTQANTGNDPSNDDGTNWVRYGRTNYWNCLANDTAAVTEAETTDGIEYEFEVDGEYDTIAFLGLRTTSVQVVVKNASAVEVSNETQTATETFDSSTWYRPVLVFNIATEANFTIEVTIADPGVVETTVGDTGVTDALAQCAKIVIGNTHQIADTVWESTTVGFVDYSTKEQDSDGEWSITERGFSKRVNFSLSHPSTRNRWIMDILLWKSTTPCLWWVDDESILDYGVMVYGYVMEPEMRYFGPFSETDVEVLGLSFSPPKAYSNPAISPNPPGSFASGDWSVASGGSTSINVTISEIDPIALDIEYRYRLSVGPGSWSSAASSGGLVDFSITGLTPETEYDVQIRTTNGAGESDWSTEKSATTDAGTAPVTGDLIAYITAYFSSDETVLDGDPIEWDTAENDDGWGWTPGGSMFTVPAGMNVAIVNVHIRDGASDGTDNELIVELNGSQVARSKTTAQVINAVEIYTVLDVSQGDEIEIIAGSSGTDTVIDSGVSNSFICIEGYSL